MRTNGVVHAALALALSTVPALRASAQTTLDVVTAVGNDVAGFQRGLEALRRADVRADVRQARARGSRLLIGMSGFTPYIPGFGSGSKPPQGYTVVFIAGTSDAIGRDPQEAFGMLLGCYARSYNKGIVGQPEGSLDDPELLQLEQVWNEAHKKSDAAALEALWAKDLVVQVPRMTPLTKEAALAIVRSGHMTFERYETSAIEVRRCDSIAIVTGRLHRTRRGQNSVAEDHWRFTKVYVRSNSGQWRVVSFYASDAPAAK